MAQPAGFEPARGDPIGFLDETSLLELVKQLVRGLPKVCWGEVGCQVVVWYFNILLQSESCRFDVHDGMF